MRNAVISFPMFGDSFAIDPPYAINIGSFSIYFYGIIIACGLLLAIMYGAKNCNRMGLDKDSLFDLVIWGVIFAIIGARAYYCIFNWGAYADNPVKVFSIRDGGLAIYGGIIGATLALYFRCRAKGWSIFPALDLMSFGLLIGQSIGRWGNFFNREAFGYETDIFCRMGLSLNGTTIYVHPTFLYESLWNAAGFIAMHIYSRRHHKYRGEFFLLYVAWYGLGRTLIEGLRSDSLWLIPDVIRVSQLLAALTFIIALVLLIVNMRRVSAGKAPAFGRSLDAGNTSASAPITDHEPGSVNGDDVPQTPGDPEKDEPDKHK